MSVTIKRRHGGSNGAAQTMVFTIHRQSEFQRLQRFTARGSGWGDAAALGHLPPPASSVPSGDTEGYSARGVGQGDAMRRMGKWQRYLGVRRLASFLASSSFFSSSHFFLYSPPLLSSSHHLLNSDD